MYLLMFYLKHLYCSGLASLLIITFIIVTIEIIDVILLLLIMRFTSINHYIVVLSRPNFSYNTIILFSDSNTGVDAEFMHWVSDSSILK